MLVTDAVSTGMSGRGESSLLPETTNRRTAASATPVRPGPDEQLLTKHVGILPWQPQHSLLT